MPYNLSFMDNSTTLSGLFIGVNNMASGWLFGGFMLVLFIVGFMVFYGRVGVGELLFGLGLVMSIIGGLLAIGGFLPGFVVGITLSILVIGLLTMYMS